MRVNLRTGGGIGTLKAQHFDGKFPRWLRPNVTSVDLGDLLSRDPKASHQQRHFTRLLMLDLRVTRGSYYHTLMGN